MGICPDVNNYESSPMLCDIMNKFTTSTGERVSQATIDRRRKEAYQNAWKITVCECCHEEMATDHDHSISQARCKQLHKTELIWDADNWSASCRECHSEWESYRSGKFEDHKNVVKRMLFVKKHDPQGFEKRRQHLSNYKVMKAIQ